MDMNFKKDISVDSGHVEHKVKECAEKSHWSVDQNKECKHLHFSPKRLNQFPTKAHSDNINYNFPEIEKNI